MSVSIQFQSALPREIRFLLSLAAGQAREIPQDLDWAYFSSLVQKSRALPLLAAGIRALPQNEVRTVPALSAIPGEAARRALPCMMQIEALKNVMTLFAAANIRAISMKGPILALQLYGNPAMRFSNDLDIWADPAKLGEAIALLEENGWDCGYASAKQRRAAMHRGHDISLTKNGQLLELHWKAGIWKKEDFEDVWSRRSSCRIAGLDIPCPGPTDNFSYLILHAGEHGYFRLRWLMDLYRLAQLPGIPWEAILSELRRTDRAAFLYEALLMMEHIGIGIPDGVQIPGFSVQKGENGFTAECSGEDREALELAAVLTEKAAAMLPSLVDNQEDDPAYVKYRQLLPGFRRSRSLRGILYRIFVPTEMEWEQITLPDSLYFLYCPLRLWNVLSRIPRYIRMYFLK